MNGITRRHREFTSEEIFKLVERYRSSGLGVRRFAQQQGISPGRMHYWVYQKSQAKPDEPVRSSGSDHKFQEVRVAVNAPVLSAWAVEVGLPTGVAVRFGGAATPDLIGEVVQALQRPC